MLDMKRIPTLTIIMFLCVFSWGQSFRHPGLLQTSESLSRMKLYVEKETEPAISSFRALKSDFRSQSDYEMRGPFRTIARDGKHAGTKGPSESDFTAAYYNALMYHISGVEAHKAKSLEIINAYADSLYTVDGHDAPLCCLQGYYLVNAMELMRNEASQPRQQQWADMIRRAFISVMDRFEAMSPYANGNWGAIVNKMRMAVAVYSDDRAMYDKAKQMFLQCNDNAALPNYIGITGQCQETGRDQGHAQLGIGNLAEICEIAWNQGDDLWGALDDRMLKGYEYTAKYNLGYDVPFTTWTDCTGLYNDWTEPGQMGRGKPHNIYEIAYAHFAGRLGKPMPYTAMMLGKAGGVRPEVKTGNCDAIGLGSLLFYNGTAADNRTKPRRIPDYTKMHQVFTYPAPEGAPLKSEYDVYIQPRESKEWIKIDTYMAKVNAPKGGTLTGHAVSEISYAYFDFTGDVFVKVITKNRKYKKARIRPDYRGTICNHINDSTVQFLLFQPENVSVEFDDDITSNLLVFTSKPQKTVEEARKEARRQKRNFVYYAPGIYTSDSIKVESNTTYYLSGGAYFTGTFAVNDVHDVSIIGRGIARPVNGYEGAHVYRSRNVLIDGLILNTCPIGESCNITLHDVRSISHPQWGDGLNVFGGCSDILFDRVFCRNSDDCTTAYATRKGFSGNVTNVRMTNSTLWADVAHPIMIGLHGNGSTEHPDTVSNLTYENIDIICQSEQQIDYQGCLAINCGDNNLVRNVTFDNIRIEDIRCGSLLHVKSVFNDKYSLSPGGRVEDILFRTIRYYGETPTLSIISGYSPERSVSNITFEGLKINGKHIHDAMPDKPRWYHTSDKAGIYVGNYVNNIIFR